MSRKAPCCGSARPTQKRYYIGTARSVKVRPKVLGRRAMISSKSHNRPGKGDGRSARMF